MLNVRKRNAMRRLVLNETPVEVADDLGVTPETIRRWLSDPLFQSEMFDMQKRMEDRIIAAQTNSENLDALEILENSATEAALLCSDVMTDEDADIGLRVRTAWDILDRTKGKPVQRKLTASVSLVDLIIQAGTELDEDSEDSLEDTENVTPTEI